MLAIETLKLLAATLTVLAGVVGILGKPTNEAGKLTPRGRRLISLAILSFVCAIGLQVAQYLNVLESSRTLETRHREIVASMSRLREGAEAIRGETSRLSAEASKIAWGLTIDPVPIRELHLQCDFDGPIERLRLNERGALKLNLGLFRSHQGELELTVIPRLTGSADSPVGTLFVGQPTFRAQNISLTEISISTRLPKEDGEPFLLWVELPVAQVRDGARQIPGNADWPLPTVAYFRRTRLSARIEGSLVQHVRAVLLMINRDLLLEIPLSPGNGRREGEVTDGFSALRPRYSDSRDNLKK